MHTTAKWRESLLARVRKFRSRRSGEESFLLGHENFVLFERREKWSLVHQSPGPVMNTVSSSLCRRLRHIYLQKSSSANAVLTSTRDNNIQNLVNQFKNSSSSGFRGQRLIYKTTVRRLAKAGRFSSIHDILDHQKRYPDIKDEHFTARLINLCGQAKMLDHALQLFD
ncbi:hypothetical protein DH2020_045704 [Rehmannia glutinosa]|uniref:Pentatricopeptide repeat-containing protein n=1 Tax=Rehmannia glutinosa TaxID=99300 RepID=A0ABR0UE12_REHGL